ncbi:Uncharacterised protein [Vibrio cholerae]|nr:Uncharacterised protein [Vibrio cholerae]CSI55942.1 Uncharacterised protein [Vibrio cholerae]CSI63442.1 Uncharacterised protein [Vibrio cholerae]
MCNRSMQVSSKEDKRLNCCASTMMESHCVAISVSWICSVVARALSGI